MHSQYADLDAYVMNLQNNLSPDNFNPREHVIRRFRHLFDLLGTIRNSLAVSRATIYQRRYRRDLSVRPAIVVNRPDYVCNSEPGRSIPIIFRPGLSLASLALLEVKILDAPSTWYRAVDSSVGCSLLSRHWPSSKHMKSRAASVLFKLSTCRIAADVIPRKQRVINL